MKYYYLVASLPLFVLGERTPFTTDAFREQCAGLLAEEDLAELDRLLALPEGQGHSAFARAWQAEAHRLGNALARWRASQRGVEPTPYIRLPDEHDAGAAKAVADAYAQPDPLERELALDRWRWQALDQLTYADAFGLPTVLAYALKLRIGARWAGLTEEDGIAGLERALAQCATAAVPAGAIHE